MMCYRDTTFCSSPHCRNECGRQLTAEIIAAAVQWWGSADAPFATAEFCDANGEPIKHNESEATNERDARPAPNV